MCPHFDLLHWRRLFRGSDSRMRLSGIAKPQSDSEIQEVHRSRVQGSIGLGSRLLALNCRATPATSGQPAADRLVAVPHAKTYGLDHTKHALKYNLRKFR